LTYGDTGYESGEHGYISEPYFSPFPAILSGEASSSPATRLVHRRAGAVRAILGGCHLQPRIVMMVAAREGGRWAMGEAWLKSATSRGAPRRVWPWARSHLRS
jgi:hypothetical protein